MEYTYDQCRECGRDELSFALHDGLCYWCNGTIVVVDGQNREAK